MRLFGRLKYAAFLTLAVVMAASMFLMITGLDEEGLLLQPAFVLSTLALAFIIAPWLESYLPYKRKSDSE